MNKLFIAVHKRSDSVERLYRILFYFLCILILFLSVIKIGGALNKTKIGIGDLKFRLDHVLHALAYFIFSMYYSFGKYFGLKLFKKRKQVLFFIILFVLGFLAETLQIWIPFRSFNLMDLLSNLIGIIAGYFVTTIISFKNPHAIRSEL